MATQRRIVICREGLYYSLVALAVLGGAVSRQLNLLMLLGTVLLGPLVFSLIYGRLALRRFHVQRRLPPRLRADELLFVDVHVSNQRRWLSIWAIEVRDRVLRLGGSAGSGAAAHASVSFAAVEPQQMRSAAYEGRLPLRGRYEFGPLRISTRFPLGLIRHSMFVDIRQELIVHPKLGRLTHDWARVVRQDTSGGQRMHRRGQHEADFYGLRDWRPGDNRRSIHWRTSARRGSLVVRQFEQRRSQDLAVLLDLWQPPSAAQLDQDHVESAVSFVATLIAEACQHPGRNLIIFVAGRDELHRTGPASPLFFQEQMDALALLVPHEDKLLPRSLGHVLASVAPSMPTLIVSTRAIDWQALQGAANERNVRLEGRLIQMVNVANADELSRCFHA